MQTGDAIGDQLDVDIKIGTGGNSGVGLFVDACDHKRALSVTDENGVCRRFRFGGADFIVIVSRADKFVDVMAKRVIVEQQIYTDLLRAEKDAYRSDGPSDAAVDDPVRR